MEPARTVDAMTLASLGLALAFAVPPAPGAVADDVAYRLGPGDVVEVTVEGRPELSRVPTVQTSGAVYVPGAGEVAVGGLTAAEAAARIAEALAGGGRPPTVEVRVREYLSQFVWVRGAVNQPGRKYLRGGTRLVDVLLDAGGFAADASGRLTVERVSGELPGGGRRLVLRLSGRTPTADDLRQLALFLRSGDSVTAGVQQWVRASAGVAKPGRYPFEEGLTLGALVEAAGGRAGSGKVVVRRATGDVEADLDDVRSGRAADVPLVPGDEVAARGGRR
jgi:polysaccharide export outer membrane protein